ncbi:DUF6916 family protein [Nocardioides hwasunensis]|uniref:DUF6916 domain-containing protein n=1 Tax=Nocardioides hwasunensis TaxID=397258 RepID=A0ABR8MKM9_9ACTN|nr:hypothetical protein [Nocardioides hwasunensis]MBD3915330.1 hypothetical protein [Nocardioides hwasunensis]
MSVQHADYAPRVGERFTLRRLDVQQPDVEATLTEVADERRCGGWLAWSMTFDAPVGCEQGVFEVSAPDVDARDLMLVPLAASPGGTLLHATLTSTYESENDHV